MLHNWFKRLFQSKHSAAAIRRRQCRPASYLLRLEVLEDRITPTGGLDPTFGSGGIVATTIGSYASATGMAVISSGPDAGDYVVAGIATVAGTNEFALARYTAAGVLDTTFGSGGFVTTPIGNGNAGANSVAVDNSTGDYVVAGYSQLSNFSVFTLARYTPTGALDTTFGSGGIVTTTIGPDSSYAQSVAVDNSTGDYVVAGSSQLPGYNVFALARYTPAGMLDPTFGSGGIVTTTIGSNSVANSVAVDTTTGDYLVAGYANLVNAELVLARYTSAGALDTTFGSGGIVTTAIGNNASASSVVVDSSTGDYLVAGLGEPSGTDTFALARYTSAGALDPTFGSGGIVTTPIGVSAVAESMAVDSATGDYVVAGNGFDASNHQDFALARYTPAGVLDTTFGADNSGLVLTAIGSDSFASGVAVVGGKYVAAGSADVSGTLNFALAQFNPQSAVNPPQNTVPGVQIAAENSTLTFSSAAGNAVAVSDPEAGNGTGVPQVTLAAADGTLTLASTNGLTFTTGNGTGNGVMVFTGTQAAIDASLNGLIFTPTPDFYGVATLAISTNDRNSPAKTASNLVTIFLTEVAQSPVAVNDYANTAANSSVTIPVLANDYDPNNLTGPGNAGLSVSKIDGTTAVVGTPVTLSSGGTATLNADGSITYTPAAGASGAKTFQYTVADAAGLTAVGLVTINVAPASAPLLTDAITFGPIAPVLLGSAPITLSAVGGGSSSSVVYTVLIGPGSVSANQLTVTGLGTILVEASQVGDANYLAATPVFQTVLVEPAQTITFTPPASPVTFGVAPIALSATASSGLTVTFKVVSGPGSINGNSLTVTGAGTIVVEADQPGDAQHGAAAPVQESVVVHKATDTITFPQLPVEPLGPTPITLNAVGGGSSSSIVYTVLFGPGHVSSNQLTATGLGTILIEATQAGDANYFAAAPVFQSVLVETAQTITFTPPTTPISFTNAPITLSASSSSKLPIAFSVVSGPGTVSGGKLTVTGVGSIVIEADQAGTGTFAPAPPIQHTLVVNQATQTITFNALAAVSYGTSPITLPATTSAGLPISYSVTSGPGSVTGNQLTITGVGTIAITASQTGNADYSAATPVPRTLVVNKANQTITFHALTAVTYGAAPITLGATASSGLAITYSIVSGPGSLVGNQLTITGAGSIVIKATQLGDSNHNGAAAVSQTLMVNKATLIVAANNTHWTAGVPAQVLAGFTITGFVNADTQTSLFGTEAAVVSCPTVTVTNPVAKAYVILISKGTLVTPANYTLTFQTGTLTVS